MPDNRPIGIFDSGIGGLTIARSVSNLLPHEQILFFGDTAHLPYGDKSAEAIKSYVSRIAEYFVDNDCKLILLACNSASAAAYPLIHKMHSNRVPVLNVIDPNVAVVMAKKYKTVGIIGTKATVRSRAYNRKFASLAQDLKIKSVATPLLAPMIEEGFFNNNISQTIINSYLSNKNLNGIQALILACTHYPLIKKEIEVFYRNEKAKVDVIDSTDVISDYTARFMHKHRMLAEEGRVPDHHFCVSDFTASFQKTTQIFYGEAVKLKHVAIWG